MKKRILFVTDLDKPHYYAIILERFKRIHSQCDVEVTTVLNLCDYEPSNYSLAVFFLQDLALGHETDFSILDRWLTISCINHPSEILGATQKSEMYRLFSDYCPRHERYIQKGLKDFPEQFTIDMILRDDLYHGVPMYLYRHTECLPTNPAEMFTIRFPVWVEYVDTFDIPTDRYWKYRCMFLKDDDNQDQVLPMHLQSSRKLVHCDLEVTDFNVGNLVIQPWLVRGEKRVQDNIECIAESEYFDHGISPKHKPIFCEIARKLGFDWVTFDYAFKPDGSLIIWEVNALPYLHYIEPKPIAHHIVQTYAGRSGHRLKRNVQMTRIIDEWIYWIARQVERT